VALGGGTPPDGGSAFSGPVAFVGGSVLRKSISGAFPV